jgi:germination protein M
MFNKLLRASAILMLVPLALTGCSVFGPKKHTTRPIDPPPASAHLDNAKPVAAAQKAEQKKESGMELYFLTDTGYVVPYVLNIPAAKGIAKEALKFMVQGGPGEGLLPAGFSPILPKGTQIKALSIKDGVATIDFSKHFLNYAPNMEEKILNAVTWTLTGFSSVKEVNIRVEGKPLLVMPKKKTPAQGLTRNRGINLEVVEGTELSQSMPVTVYFLGQTSNNDIYYVPVTRMVNRTDNVAEVAMQELIKGPQQ